MFYKLDELAGEFKISVRTLRKEIHDGNIVACKVRGRIRIRQEDAEEYMRRSQASIDGLIATRKAKMAG